ncbi:arabinose 5-phosphate isomerase KpsF-like [Hydractinia symbiolongicarpus]|uniref:arabinose 5-phosphate isomerase KpsF-like n=1 Tax=Hydractinia symbiolongicarpus TaxID=13093 RepID=UPI00254ECDAF|nr:arabinose 5-phosphate isomerase KpsF-like [Hydractinia symbiolongicarpus]
MPNLEGQCLASPPVEIENTLDHEIKHSRKTDMCTDEFYSSIKKDMDAAKALADVLKCQDVNKFVNIINQCHGTLLTSGIGKSGIVAERMSTSLSSTGTPAHYVHGAEWTHGDLGKGRRDDVVIFFSHSGNTRECVFAANHLRQRGVHILSIIGHDDCALAKCSDAFICYKLDHELGEPIGGVPTTSIILQEMVINAVVCELIRRRRYTKIEFARNHPGGSLGKKLCDTPEMPK